MRRFRARLRFFAQWTRRRCPAIAYERCGPECRSCGGSGTVDYAIERFFEARPYFDESIGQPSGYTEMLVDDQVWYVAIDRNARWRKRQRRVFSVPIFAGPPPGIPGLPHAA